MVARTNIKAQRDHVDDEILESLRMRIVSGNQEKIGIGLF